MAFRPDTLPQKASKTPFKDATSWIPAMNCGQNYRFDDDDSSIVDSIPITPTSKNGNTFGFTMNQFLSPIMSCMAPNIQMCSGTAPSECVSSAMYCRRDMPDPRESSRRPEFLNPIIVRRLKPNPNDVVCGKGHNQSSHTGNRNLRDLIAANQETYASLTKKEKQNMSRQIVALILLHTEPAGRFLVWESSSGLFVDVGLPRSIEKTNQGFRDALVHSNVRDDNRPKQQQRRPLQIPDHLTEVFSKVPKPQDFLQYPELMGAMKHMSAPPPFMRRPPSQPLPGLFPATNPCNPPAIVSPREYLPSTHSVRRHPNTKKKLDFPPGLATPVLIPDVRGREQPYDPFDVSDDIAPITSSTTESPRRIHDWKRRRTGDNGDDLNHSFESNNSLTEAMESRLTLNERVVRCPIPKMTKTLDVSVDSTDGQAALAATAFLRLDDSY